MKVFRTEIRGLRRFGRRSAGASFARKRRPVAPFSKRSATGSALRAPLLLLASTIWLLFAVSPCAAGSDLLEIDLEKKSFRDSSGRTMRVEKPFERIVSLYAAHTVNLFRLGLDREIIGVSKSDDYPPEALEKPRFSGHDGPEKYLAARPDLVLVRPMLDRGYAPLMERLRKFGIAVVSLQPSNVEEMYDYWRVLGLLTGRTGRAEEMVETFREGLAEVRRLVERIDEKDRQRVYFEAIHSKMKTFLPDSLPMFALEQAGGINVARDASAVRNTIIGAFGKERILSLADEIDVYLAQRGTMNNVTGETVAAEPGFSVIKAVREGRVHLVDEKTVARPTMRLLEAIGTIGSHLYPDVFTPEAVSRIVAGAAIPGPEANDEKRESP